MEYLTQNLTLHDIVTQAVGFLGMLAFFISYQQNTNKRIVGLNIAAATFFLTHYFMLGAYTGAFMNLLALLRNIVFFFRPRKWAGSRLWLWAFCAAYIIAGALTFDSVISIFPTAAVVLGTVALYIKVPKQTRRLMFLSTTGWLVYNIYNGSIAGYTSDSLALISIMIAFVKYDL